MGEASKRRAASARTAASAPTVPSRLMASARSVGVRSLSPGVGVEAQTAMGGADERGDRLVERALVLGQGDPLGEDEGTADR